MLAWEESLALNLPRMDDTHREFVDLLNAVAAAPKEEFKSLFARFHDHVAQHFEYEESLMEAHGFPAKAEHRADHNRVLGDLTQFARQVEKGRSMMARAYITERLPEWFSIHLATMDAALAAHVNRG